jgi:hypothetical protein
MHIGTRYFTGDCEQKLVLLLSPQALETINSKEERAVRDKHFKACKICQKADLVHRKLDPTDSRFLFWCDLLWLFGPLTPSKKYRVERYTRPMKPFKEWIKGKRYRHPEIAYRIAYTQASVGRPTRKSVELGSKIWEQPISVATVQDIPKKR